MKSYQRGAEKPASNTAWVAPRPRTDDAVGGTRDPTWIGGAPVDVVGAEIENVAGGRKLRQHRAVHVLRPLGTAVVPEV